MPPVDNEPITPTTTVEGKTKKYCPFCGAYYIVEEGWIYCGNCGKKLP